MDSEVKWVCGAMVVLFGMIFGGIFYSDHLTHMTKMECMKLRGEWVGSTCIFREQPSK